ncbi:MAG: D-2-hydroxyacid dehydrogenase [Planctomycetes bacterium]|nr:D-2-hydroxyacid dehydrogenase [Planctomycetota bacterium]
MKLVIHLPVEAARLARICEVAGPLHVVNAPSANVAAEIVEADAFFGKLTPTLLRAAQRLKWVQAPTASLEHYVFPELIEHPCVLTNMRGLFSDVIADHVLGLVICFARNLHLYVRNQCRRVWEPVGGEEGRSDFISGPGVVGSIDRHHLHLADCTLGVVGAGAIGSEIARRARAFDMTVVAVDPRATSIPDVCDVWPTARLNDLLAVSDFVVIAAPHTPETQKLFRTPQFACMRRSAYLINIGRGAIVDLADLTAALRDKVIAGAGLDVFETEPLPAEHPLWDMPNVIITPHVAGASPRIAERHTEVLLENIRRFVAGVPLLTPVDKRQWF